jgi:hypothetical protein
MLENHLGNTFGFLSLQNFFNITQLVQHKLQGLLLHAKSVKLPSLIHKS